jgi:hypothetical protein
MNPQNPFLLALTLSQCLLLAACASHRPTQVPPAVSSSSCESATGLANQPLDSSFTSDRVIGGGTIETDQFQFEAYLYCDPALRSDASASELASAIAGLGVHTAWRYDGADLSGPVLLDWAIGEVQRPSGGWDGGLTRGSVVAYTGGINLPEGSPLTAKGGLLQVSFGVIAQGARAGAVFIFELHPSADGYVPTNIRLESRP